MFLKCSSFLQNFIKINGNTLILEEKSKREKGILIRKFKWKYYQEIHLLEVSITDGITKTILYESISNLLGSVMREMFCPLPSGLIEPNEK